MWAQPFLIGGFALMFLGVGVLGLVVATTDPSAPLWGRALATGFAVMSLGLAGLVVLAGAVVAGPEGVGGYRIWQQRRRWWLSWGEIESFGTDRMWISLGVVLEGGEFQSLASVASLWGYLDGLVALLLAVVLGQNRKGPFASNQRAARRLADRIAEVRYLETGDAGAKDIVVVETPPRPSRQVSIGGRRTHDEVMVTKGSDAPYMLPSERANAQAASRRRSRFGRRKRRRQ